MKREIKFRAWDSVNKKWLWPYPDGFSVIGEVTVFDLLKQQTPCPDIYGGIEICQFTGLHDKNGQEIYEGDIFGNDNMPTRYVVFEDGKFCFNKVHTQGPDVLSQDRIGRLKIVGNIYENPDLLK